MNEIMLSSMWKSPRRKCTKYQNKSNTKTTVSLYLDKNLVQSAKNQGLNLSKVTENALLTILNNPITRNSQRLSLPEVSFTKENSMAGPVGFEPTISGSEGRHLNPC